MKIRSLFASLVTLAVVAAANAQTTPDYGADITANFTIIDTLWGKVATLMIAVALVTVAVKFFRKAK